MYEWVKLLHVASAFGFLALHGVSMVAAFRVRQESDPAALRGLLNASAVSVGPLMAVTFLLLLGSGIWLGFLGNWWGAGWLWTAIGVLALLVVTMTPMAGLHFAKLRRAVGAPIPWDKKPPDESQRLAQPELDALRLSWNPLPIALLGGVGLLVILWMMLLKPF